MGISTHVLDTSLGRPARGVPVVLEFHEPLSGWQVIGKGATDADGRLKGLLPPQLQLRPGNYRITFDTGTWFSACRAEGFYPEVSVVFTIRDAAQHYHVPLLLSPFGYSTYRGS
ncbi:MAG TPA: hydroxyisourate hydrolase [Blastocatellia bacterium]|nr:hydroxyisourate hydrolase [Blastocatellia bacterium]